VTPDRFRILVSRILILGVSVSATLIAVGFVGSLLVGWEGSLVGAATIHAPITDFGTVIADLLAVRPIGLVQAGLVVLIATPVVRVAASVVAFTLEGDSLYAALTLAVLAILLTSLIVLR
jgi:uncharacterized membrane protein